MKKSQRRRKESQQCRKLMRLIYESEYGSFEFLWEKKCKHLPNNVVVSLALAADEIVNIRAWEDGGQGRFWAAKEIFKSIAKEAHRRGPFVGMSIHRGHGTAGSQFVVGG